MLKYLVGLLVLQYAGFKGSSQQIYDSILFRDKNYHFSVQIFTSSNFGESKKNAVFTFYKLENTRKIILRRDSLACMDILIDNIDFNNDRIKDLMIFHSTGARANPTYYLYLVDSKRHRLLKVSGFQNLPNPNLDTHANIIVSVALAGRNYYSFYRLSKNNELIGLLKDVEDDPNDSLWYDRIIYKLRKKK